MYMYSVHTYIMFQFVFFFFLLANGAPPSPVRCEDPTGTCMVFSAYGVWPDRSLCRINKVLFPSTEEELVNAVAYGVQNNMKIKVVSASAHSIPKLVCPGGDTGLLISTAKYNTRILINNNSMTVTAESGVELRDLLAAIGVSGLALPASPYWNGISIGGLISTGSHGSTLFGRGSAVHEYVVGMRMVVPTSPEDGYAKVIEITEDDTELMDAAKVSLGVLGAISTVTLQLESLFKRSVTNLETSDLNLEDRMVEFGRTYEFGDVTWYPSRYRVMYREDNRVPIRAKGEGVNDFVGFQPTLVPVVETQRTLEETNEALGNAQGKCAAGLIQTAALLAVGQGFKSSLGAFTGYPIVGFQHKIQSSGGCQHSVSREFVCPWDPEIHGLFYHQTTVSIPLTRISEFIKDIKLLRNMNPSGLCGVELYNGFLMRYVKASSAYLGKVVDAVDVDITYYRARDENQPRLDEDVLEEIEQMALGKYGGLPHWGKNRNVAYAGVYKKYPNINKFLQVKNTLDPNGVFSSEWSDSILGIAGQPQIYHPHCALEGLCVCTEDEHCAPERNYFCRPGRVYGAARVCRLGK